jgi:hypothetical protein
MGEYKMDETLGELLSPGLIPALEADMIKQ